MINESSEEEIDYQQLFEGTYSIIGMIDIFQDILSKKGKLYQEAVFQSLDVILSQSDKLVKNQILESGIIDKVSLYIIIYYNYKYGIDLIEL